MIKFHYHPSPNPAKVALFLEEAGLEFELVPVDIRKGEQHLRAFTAINPNEKTSALVDGDAVVFDSNAILFCLADKIGKFLSEPTPSARARSLLRAEAWQKLASVERLLDEINARLAAQRVEALKAKHACKTEMDDCAKKTIFPQDVHLAVREAA